MRFGSVCSGIEAASVAFAPMGFEAAWFSEIEPFSCRVLAHHYPGVMNHGDMSTLPEDILCGEVEAPDILCGGTPCQAFSVAGLRNSLEDARGNLSLIFCEVANAIDAVRASRGEQPAIVFWENVVGVLNTHDNAFGCFLAGLVGESVPLVAPGGKWPNAGVVVGPQRTIAWRVLDAQYFGLAQRRKRVFVVASARDGFDCARILLESEGVRRDSPPSREAGQEVTGTVGARTSSGGGFDTDFECSGGLQPCVTVMAHGQANAEITENYAPTLNCNHEQPIIFKEASCQNGNELSSPQTATRMETALNAESTTPIANVQGQPKTRNTSTGSETEFLKQEPSRTYALAGNTIGREPQNGGNGTGYDDSGVSYTLTKTDVHAVAFCDVVGALRSNMHNNSDPMMEAKMHVTQGMQVRRLTPVECERLQGFPKNYTNIPKASNSARYKALGNSWAVPVVHWIGWRIWAELFT